MLKNFCENGRRKKLVRNSAAHGSLKKICETLTKVIKSQSINAEGFSFGGIEMNELVELSADELQLIDTYRAMSVDCREFALAMCQTLARHGKFFARMELMSNNQASNNSIVAVGGSVYMNGKERGGNGAEAK